MRYVTPVFFQKIREGEYDQSTGNYGTNTVKEVKKLASVMNTGIETMILVYGKLKQGSLVVQLQMHYKESFDRIRVGDKLYQVDRERKLRTKHVFVVSEML